MLLPPGLLGRDEVGGFEHAEVLHHAEARELGEHGAQLAERLTVAGEQRVEQGSTVGVGQRPEDEFHRSNNT